MSLCIIDPAHNIPGFKQLFPNADYYVYEPDNNFNYYCPTHMTNNTFKHMYGFNYISDWSNFSKYDTVIIAFVLYDAIIDKIPHAVFMYNKISEIISTNKFKHIVFVDTHDYDYDPSEIDKNNSLINIYLKRNFSIKKIYSHKVKPFPFCMFVQPCVLHTLLNRPTYTKEQIMSRRNEIVWSGALYKHIGIRCNIVRDRTTIFNQIQQQYPIISQNIPAQFFISTISQYKFALDLMGVGDPNKRTFEIFNSGSLWFTNITDLIWPFEDKFPEECTFTTASEFVEKITKLQNNDELYWNVYCRQRAIIDKYMTADSIKSYIMQYLE
jgi:hypothetical protein